MASTRGEEYARRQRAEGRAKRTLWLNPEEFEAAKQARDRLHGGAAPAAQTDLEDAAIEDAVSVDTAADEKAALAKLGEAIAEILDTVTPQECRNYFKEAGYDRD